MVLFCFALCYSLYWFQIHYTTLVMLKVFVGCGRRDPKKHICRASTRPISFTHVSQYDTPGYYWSTSILGIWHSFLPFYSTSYEASYCIQTHKISYSRSGNVKLEGCGHQFRVRRKPSSFLNAFSKVCTCLYHDFLPVHALSPLFQSHI